MRIVWSILKWFLVVWGGVCLVGVLVLGGAIAFQIGPGNVDRSNAASKKDVRFVLNWCELGDERIEKVVHSYQSARSFTGDHLDAYAIKITYVSPEELTRDDFGSRWFRCDKLDGVLKDAVDFAVSWLHQDEISWFMNENELRSEEVFVYPGSINCHGTQPDAVELIFVRPKHRMVFYVSAAI